jgi:hypothetical protein
LIVAHFECPDITIHSFQQPAKAALLTYNNSYLRCGGVLAQLRLNVITTRSGLPFATRW